MGDAAMAGGDVIRGAGGNDTINGLGGADRICGKGGPQRDTQTGCEVRTNIP